LNWFQLVSFSVDRRS